MITSSAWAGKRFAVLGLARSGAAVVSALVASGAEVVAWDSDEGRREALVDAVQDAPRDLDRVALTLADPTTVDLGGIDALVVSPGVPLNSHPVAAKARNAGVQVIGDIELFAQARAALPPHKVVGITGTNGKSTTTALVHYILQTASVPTLMGGNIGLPILSVEPLPEGGIYVLELSSYQLDLTHSLDCEVAVLLNVTPDHLDRYDSFDAYAASKARLFEMQSANHEAIVGIGNAASATIARSLADREDHLTKIAPGVCLDQRKWPALQGPHNAQNALAAIAVAKALGVGERDIDRALESFAGLPHRTQLIATRGGVRFVDDSKATNPDSTAPALAAYSHVHWILGGRAKGDDLDACLPYLEHVARAYTIGEAGPVFARVLHDRVPVEEAGTLAKAVTSAGRQAVPGETVLLSPAAASFDQFRDYEHRGQAFREAVEALP